ncbi:MAG: hypothetical protein V9E85_00170 [Candidatus Nanopelagicales bacterium]
MTNEINNEADGHASILGDLYRGRDTSISDLEAAFAWTMECRQFDDPKNELTDATDALTSDQLSALKGTHVNESLPSVLGEWEVARDALLACFAIERAEDLADELDDYEEAQAIIVDFMADSTGKDEWFDYHAARTSLAKHNLLDVVDFCIDEGVPASVVPDVILKATLSGWIDDVLKSDPALTTTRSDDRDGLVDDYRSLRSPGSATPPSQKSSKPSTNGDQNRWRGKRKSSNAKRRNPANTCPSANSWVTPEMLQRGSSPAS